MLYSCVVVHHTVVEAAVVQTCLSPILVTFLVCVSVATPHTELFLEGRLYLSAFIELVQQSTSTNQHQRIGKPDEEQEKIKRERERERERERKS